MRAGGTAVECPRGGPLLPYPRVLPLRAHERNIAYSDRLTSAAILFKELPERRRSSVLAANMQVKGCGRFGKNLQILARCVEAGGCNSRGCWQCEDDRCGSRQDMPAFEPLEDAQSKLSTHHAAAGTYWPLTLPGTERNQLQRPLPARVACNDKHLLRSGPACF